MPGRGAAGADSRLMTGFSQCLAKLLMIASCRATAQSDPRGNERTPSASAYLPNTRAASTMCSTEAPSITAPGSVSRVQLPLPGSSTTACPPWRNMAVSKLVLVRRLGSMKTMASTFFSSPPLTSPA